VSWRWRMACLAATSYLIYAAALCAWIAGAIPGETARPVIDLVFGLDQWTWMTAIMGFARVHLSQADNPARRYLTEAIFPFYIVHQTVIIVLAWALMPYRLPIALEAIVIVVVTAMGCVATFEVVRRVSWLRPLFGLKRAV
jgi:glucans biosynthesis protein C